MTITLDTIEFINPVTGKPVKLKLFPETFERQVISTEWERAIDGTRHEWSRDTPGHAFDLTGTDKTGYVAKATLDAVNTLATVKNATYELNYEGTLYSVSFRFEDRPVITADPVIYQIPEAAGDLYNNIMIKLWNRG